MCQDEKTNWTIAKDDEFLEHHGILGMKWGVRRFQNPDGSLTAAGKKRQERFEAREAKKAISKKTDEAHGKDPRKMSDEEIRTNKARIQAERELRDLQHPVRAALRQTVAAAAKEAGKELLKKAFGTIGGQLLDKAFAEKFNPDKYNFDDPSKVSTKDLNEAREWYQAQKAYQKAKDSVTNTNRETTNEEAQRQAPRTEPKKQTPRTESQRQTPNAGPQKQTPKTESQRQAPTAEPKKEASKPQSQKEVPKSEPRIEVLITPVSRIEVPKSIPQLVAKSPVLALPPGDPDKVKHGIDPINSEEELLHYGTAGMRWGRRRYETEDGHLTEAGKERYLEGRATTKAAQVMDRLRSASKSKSPLDSKGSSDTTLTSSGARSTAGTSTVTTKKKSAEDEAHDAEIAKKRAEQQAAYEKLLDKDSKKKGKGGGGKGKKKDSGSGKEKAVEKQNWRDKFAEELKTANMSNEELEAMLDRLYPDRKKKIGVGEKTVKHSEEDGTHFIKKLFGG